MDRENRFSVETSKDFVKEFDLLPKNIRSKFWKLVELLSLPPFENQLHAKKLQGPNSFFSFRISRDYRVLFEIRKSENCIFLLHVGHRKDIYK